MTKKTGRPTLTKAGKLIRFQVRLTRQQLAAIEYIRNLNPMTYQSAIVRLALDIGLQALLKSVGKQDLPYTVAYGPPEHKKDDGNGQA